MKFAAKTAIFAAAVMIVTATAVASEPDTNERYSFRFKKMTSVAPPEATLAREKAKITNFMKTLRAFQIACTTAQPNDPVAWWSGPNFNAPQIEAAVRAVNEALRDVNPETTVNALIAKTKAHLNDLKTNDPLEATFVQAHGGVVTMIESVDDLKEVAEKIKAETMHQLASVHYIMGNMQMIHDRILAVTQAQWQVTVGQLQPAIDMAISGNQVVAAAGQAQATTAAAVASTLNADWQRSSAVYFALAEKYLQMMDKLMAMV